MFNKFLEGFAWSLGFFTIATITLLSWEHFEYWTKLETKEVELTEIKLLSMNIDKVDDEMMFAGQFESSITDFYEDYSLYIDLFTTEGTFVSSCYRGVDNVHIEKDKTFYYTLNCEPFSKPEQITNAKIKLYGSYKE